MLYSYSNSALFFGISFFYCFLRFARVFTSYSMLVLCKFLYVPLIYFCLEDGTVMVESSVYCSCHWCQWQCDLSDFPFSFYIRVGQRDAEIEYLAFIDWRHSFSFPHFVFLWFKAGSLSARTLRFSYSGRLSLHSFISSGFRGTRTYWALEFSSLDLNTFGWNGGVFCWTVARHC